ncbi:MAG: PAS domain S-box protein [Desulfobacteraceae bacterium]|nr:MAG: PAS domain S-box protein [Desulfobacteraceae bacterium]
MTGKEKLKNIYHRLHHSLASKLIVTVGLTLLLSICTWAYFSIQYQKEKMMNEIIAGGARLTDTIKLGTHYAMMLNSRDDINQIIKNIAKQKEIESIRIYNKEGQIKFSNTASEVDQVTNIKNEACYVCHRTDPALTTLDLHERTRIIESSAGYRRLGIISPICNEPGCTTSDCHVHPEGKKILGALDVVVSLAETDREILFFEKGIIGLGIFVFVLTALIISVFVVRFIARPVRLLIDGTRKIAAGDYVSTVNLDQKDEMGVLASSVNRMGRSIHEKQSALNRQRYEYQNFFEQVPCIITVQDHDFKILRYNREFAERFNPRTDEYCYAAYKGRSEKCPDCPVEKTFQDGQSHVGEQTGLNRDGTMTYWLVRTSPIRDEEGRIIAAMEMSLDITKHRQLEEKLAASEKKYYAIFNNIPNPVFVLNRDSLEILDCNESVRTVYGYDKADIIDTSFLRLFQNGDPVAYEQEIREKSVMNKLKHITKDGKTIYVNIRISPSEYDGQKVFLVTSSDITKRLETEQQLMHAGKIATLGEMATGVAHELNQPLSVIKTASCFFMKKIERKEHFEEDVLHTMLEKIDRNVDRATRIINHMRQFARKTEQDLKKVDINRVMESAFDIFSQQLKIRGVETVWEIDEHLPMIIGDAGRLEQVLINLLLNARDAIEEKEKRIDPDDLTSEAWEKKIYLRSRLEDQKVIVEVEDTGQGIPPDIQDKIFEPFFTTKEVGKGTGLGLSIGYGIVKDCGGDILVKSTPGSGACFTLLFPAVER